MITEIRNITDLNNWTCVLIWKNYVRYVSQWPICEYIYRIILINWSWNHLPNFHGWWLSIIFNGVPESKYWHLGKLPTNASNENFVVVDTKWLYLLGLCGKLRARPKSVSESINPPEPCGIDLTYLQLWDGVPSAVKLPRPTGISSRPIMCRTS